MNPYYQDLHNTLYCQDFRKNELPDESVQMVVTSPPYWGLRKYSGEQELIWGGEPTCEHKWGSTAISNRHDHRWATSSPVENRPTTQYIEVEKGQYCQLCNAWRGSYGLEPTPEMYVDHTIEILRDIRRVLRKDGVVFWDIGDSYTGTTSGGNKVQGNPEFNVNRPSRELTLIPARQISKGMKSKDLCLIPFRVAIAAQEDGWWVRSIIIWNKPNPMPESVTDRPTESHEYILMLTKSAKYYWDQEAVRETADTPLDSKASQTFRAKGGKAEKVYGEKHLVSGEKRVNNGGRNIRTVWDFPTQPYPEAHFAVFPEKLPELCIKAAAPEVGCCSKCGKPWTRVLSRGFTKHDGETESRYPEGTTANRLAKLRQASRENGVEYQNIKQTIGWKPTCKCNADKVPSVVLDPFSGAGTTLWVSKKLNRRAIGFDISEEYCQLAVKRMRQQVMM